MYLFIVGANIQKKKDSVKFSRKLIAYKILKPATALPTPRQSSLLAVE